MRVIGGEARGRRLKAPKGPKTRPTADRVRQTLFDVLGQRCDGLLVLDLFAGSGALGIEALSRGAQSCVFVENDKNALMVLQENLDHIGFGKRALVRQGDALSLDLLPGAPFDLVLADPPYSMGASKALLRIANLAPALLVQGARIVVEHSRREEQPQSIGPLFQVDQRRFGDTMLTFFTHDEARP